MLNHVSVATLLAFVALFFQVPAGANENLLGIDHGVTLAWEGLLEEASEDASSVQLASCLNDSCCPSSHCGSSQCSPSRSGPSKHINSGFLDFNTYWDTRDFAVTTINMAAILANDFDYFQFVNFSSPIGSNTHDTSEFFTEMNLAHPIYKDSKLLAPFDWNIQYSDGTFARGLVRFATRWRVADTPGVIGKLFREVAGFDFYNVYFHAVETDGTGVQLEQAYRRTFFDGKMYVSGFADFNINDVGENVWVTEHQIGAQIVGQWFAVAEYRINEFDPPGRQNGWGFGLEYVVLFGT